MASSDSSNINVLIVGAGIGGLTAALELHRHGFEIQIIERSRSENNLGDSLALGPSAMDCIERNLPAVFEDLQQIVYDPQIYFYKYTGEKVLGPTRWAYLKAGETGSGPTGMARFTRPQLHHVLLKHVEKAGINLTWGKKAKQYFEDASERQAGVICDDDSKFVAELVIAADGVRTASWDLIAGEKPSARSSGKAIFRTAFPLKHAMSDPAVVQRFRLDDPQTYVEIYQGPNLHGGIGRTVDELTWFIAHADAGSADENWGNRVHPEVVAKMLEQIPGWDPLFIQAVRLTPPDQLVDWKLMFRDPQPQWHSAEGLVIQLGDSAHSFLPTSGNGATQAIEDVFSLVACLIRAGKDHVKDAVQVHCKLRFERVSCIQLLGFYNQFTRTKTDWSKVKEAPESINMGFGKWIWSHDPEHYVKQRYDEALEHIRRGIAFKNTNIPPGYTYRPWTLDDMMKIDQQGGQVELDGEWF